jgi:hypothetical protein
LKEEFFEWLIVCESRCFKILELPNFFLNPGPLKSFEPSIFFRVTGC